MTKNTINIIRSGKNYAGKTSFSQLLASYYNFISSSLLLFDGDIDEVMKIYNLKIFTSFKLDLKDKVIRKKITSSVNDVLLNLSGTQDLPKGDELLGIDSWLAKYNLTSASILKAIDKNIVHWFLSDGSLESFNSFKFVARAYGKVHKIILVKNLGVNNSWSKKNKPSSADIKFKKYAEDNCLDYAEAYFFRMGYDAKLFTKKYPKYSLDTIIIDDNIRLPPKIRIINFLIEAYPQIQKIVGGNLPISSFTRKSFFDYMDGKICRE